MLKEYPVTQSSVNKVTGMEMFSKVKISQPAEEGFRACYFSSPTSSQVFCSQWLSHKQVIFGTKCNKLMVLDVNTKHLDQIPSLASSENSNPPDQECGIHSIEMNPSGTLLATGARNSNDVAVYRLPTLDPICVGENAHNDWIFDQVMSSVM